MDFIAGISYNSGYEGVVARLATLSQRKQLAMNSSSIYIYGLWCPVSNNIRYVGKSVKPESRFSRHLTDKSDTHKVRWLNGLLAIGLQPSLRILEVTNNKEWESRERYWIEKLKDNLTNETLGGDGREKGFTHKPDAIKKIKDALKKRPIEIRRQAAIKTSLKLKGKSLTLEHCSILSNSAKLLWNNFTKEEKEKRVINLRHGWSIETREKLSCSRRGMKRGKGTSKYLGVSWFRRDKKWRAWLKINDKQLHLGYFISEVEAAKAYNEAAIKYFGEFARLNEIPHE